MILETEIQKESIEAEVSSVIKWRGCKEVARFQANLEGALVSIWELAWAVAVAVDLEVGHLGDGNPREGGVHVNAERDLAHSVYKWLLTLRTC